MVESVKLALGLFKAGHLLSTGTANPEGEPYETEKARAAIDAVIVALVLSGYVIVPVTPTEEMLEAGAAADWVGEVEGRAGLSIVPDTEMQWDDDRDGYIEVQRPGIWAAMLAKAWAALEVTYGKALNQIRQSGAGAQSVRQEETPECQEDGKPRVRHAKQDWTAPGQQDDA
jgi:hypothetical protein